VVPDLGVVLLLHRSATGVELTAAGNALYTEASTLLAQAEQARARVTAPAGAATLTVGTLADSAAEASTRLAATFRRHHPKVSIRFREADFTDPTTGLRTGLVDVALTRCPFDDTGISMRTLRSDPVGVVLRTNDPLAGRGPLRLADLADRPWFQLPDGTDPIWPRLLERGDARRRTTRRSGGAHRQRMHAGRPLERHGRHRAAHPRPARRADLGTPDRHAPEPSRCRLGDRA
jgi:DNA-binding transcriptional LysR family regulator